MNKLFTLFVAVLLLLGTTSCEQDIAYKYNKKPQPVNCGGLNKNLMHEAMYSFELDIAKHYNFRNYDPSSLLFIQNGYSNYVWDGVNSTAPFLAIYSEHSKEILKALLEQGNLYLKNGEQYQLNFEHLYVSCLIDNIDDNDLRTSIKELLKTGFFSTELMASPFRKKAVQNASDKDLAMFIGLATYYKNLLNLNVHNLEPKADE